MDQANAGLRTRVRKHALDYRLFNTHLRQCYPEVNLEGSPDVRLDNMHM